MHRSFLKYHGQHLSSPRYHRHQAKYHYSNYLTNKVYIYMYLWSFYISFRTRLPKNIGYRIVLFIGQ